MLIDEAVKMVEASDDYRLLRKHKSGPAVFREKTRPTLKAAFLDVETTGLDHDAAKIIELAIVTFEFCKQGYVYSVDDGVSMFEDPGMPIPAAITELTGIRDADVAGKKIDQTIVESLLKDVSLIIAHNAKFDRPFFEQRFPGLTDHHWACSCDGIAWKEEGFASSGLEFIAYRYGIFYEQHRALSDCHAAVYVLTQTLPKSGKTVMAELLERARMPQYRIFARNSSFNSKDALKKRKYRWDGDEKVWHTIVYENQAAEELAFLREELGWDDDTRLDPRRITSKTRYKRMDQ